MNPTSTLVRPFQKLFSTNATNASITELVPTTTAPTGDGVINSITFGGTCDSGWGGNAVLLNFYGVGANNNTFTARVTIWRLIGALWIPLRLTELSGTLGLMVGVALSDVLNTERFADTLTESTAYTTAKEIVSPANDSIAAVKLDILGATKIQVQFNKGTCTSVNGLLSEF
jgi:hypothetical protein